MSIYEFESFQLHSDRRLFLDAGKQVQLTSKAFNILLFFVQNPNRVISKEELLRSCWPTTTVLESNVTNHIFAIRQLLGEHPQEHRYIITVPGEGYRFVGEVRKLSAEADKNFEAPAARHASRDAVLNSVAVLPFRTLGKAQWRDPYLESGLADVLTARLSRLRQILVRSASAIPKDYYGKSPLVVGRKLGVDALLEGSIQRSGDSLRVTVQFMRVRDGIVLWAHKFDEKFANLFKVEDSIAEETIAALRTTFSLEEEKVAAKPPTQNSEAYDDYLKGRYFWNKRTEETLRLAVGYFEHAIQRDPNYAIAYIGLADCYNLLAFLGTIETRDGCTKATAAAFKALELDPTLAEAHTSIAFAKFCLGTWNDSKREFDKALKGAPHYATTYHWYSEYLTAQGRFDEAVAMMQRARELDPMSLTINANLGSVLFFARQYDRAIEELKVALQLDPYFVLTRWYLGQNLAQKRMFPQAVAELETALGLSQGSPLVMATLGHVYAMSNKKDKARKILKELGQLGKRRYVSAYDFATVHAGLGENAEAFRWLARAFREGSNWLAYLNVDPRMDRLRSDRRFRLLVKKIGLVR